MALGQEPAQAALLQQYLKRPPREKQGTPRRAMETFCFALDAFDRLPVLLSEAIECLDLGDRSRYPAGTPERLAVQLNEIIDELSFSFDSLLDREDGKPVTFYRDKELTIELVRGKDGLWRFSADTVERIPSMRTIMIPRSKQRNASRALLAEGMEDPTSTMVGFLEHAIAGDFHSAAARLDLTGLPPEERSTRGPLLAWKLGCVVQRAGFLYRQQIPFEADGPPYTWSINTAGRIMVERVRQPGGKDTWQFSRNTVATIDALWAHYQASPIDLRYQLVGMVIPPPPENHPMAQQGSRAAPESVPRDLASPRDTLRAFFRLMDEAEVADHHLEEAGRYLDLSHLPPGEAVLAGPRLAGMLHAVCRKITPDVSSISNYWSSPPQVISGPNGLRLEIVRCPDGCWRFSRDTAARLPAMYGAMSGQDKAGDEHSDGLGSPRETLITFFRAVNNRQPHAASRCLNLSHISPSARENLGPVLAFKLKSILDRTGRIYLQEISNDHDGPRLVLYRGTFGRIILARYDSQVGKPWLFTTSTVEDIEAMYNRLLDQPIDTSLLESSQYRLDPSLWLEPGVWVRSHMPAYLRNPIYLLGLYQWPALALVIALSLMFAYLVGRLAHPLLRAILQGSSQAAETDPTRGHLGSLRLVAFLVLLYYLLAWLDLPVAVASNLYVLEKLVLTIALVWVGFQATDILYGYYQRRWVPVGVRSLADLIAPFTRRLTKLTLFIVGAALLVYQFGQGDSMKQFLAGLGIAGLAVSLAAQDALKNVIATMLLISDHTFRVGDRLFLSGDKEGVVEEVGFRSTKLRTPEDSIITVPNAILAGGAIDNHGVRSWSRIRLPFSVMGDTSLEKLTGFCADLRGYLASRSDLDPQRSELRLTGLNEAGIGLELEAFVQTEDRLVEHRCRDEVMLQLIESARQRGVELRGIKK
ncbi:MAG: mechanosensitive ion channel family protein [Gemmataceae bacterium]